MSELAYIGLGSNLGGDLVTPAGQLAAACAALRALPQSQWLACSPIYRSVAMTLPGDTTPQPDYLNAVVALNTTLTATDLLAQLQQIESAQGRQRAQRWAARTVDLDLLLYGQQQLDQPGLTVPHPGISQRNFVLQPLQDLAPTLHIPGQGLVSDALQNIGLTGLTREMDTRD